MLHLRLAAPVACIKAHSHVCSRQVNSASSRLQSTHICFLRIASCTHFAHILHLPDCHLTSDVRDEALQRTLHVSLWVW